MMARRILIAGFGTAGRSLAEDVQRAGDRIVGYLDDVRVGDDVLGRLRDVESVAAAQAADAVYFAIPSAPGEVVRDFAAAVARAGVELAIIPRTYRIVSRERVSVSD